MERPCNLWSKRQWNTNANVVASAQWYGATVSAFSFKQACLLLLCTVVVYWGTGGGVMQRSLSTGVQFAVAIRYTLAYYSS